MKVTGHGKCHAKSQMGSRRGAPDREIRQLDGGPGAEPPIGKSGNWRGSVSEAFGLGGIGVHPAIVHFLGMAGVKGI